MESRRLMAHEIAQERSETLYSRQTDVVDGKTASAQRKNVQGQDDAKSQDVPSGSKECLQNRPFADEIC